MCYVRREHQRHQRNINGNQRERTEHHEHKKRTRTSQKHVGQSKESKNFNLKGNHRNLLKSKSIKGNLRKSREIIRNLWTIKGNQWTRHKSINNQTKAMHPIQKKEASFTRGGTKNTNIPPSPGPCQALDFLARDSVLKIWKEPWAKQVPPFSGI